MHLVSCARPIEPLEDAPRSSLLTDSASGSWTGFWSTTDEGYYARLRRHDGGEEWFRLAEEANAASTEGRTPTPIFGVRIQGAARANARRRVMLLLARSTSARGILVGNARPKSR